MWQHAEQVEEKGLSVRAEEEDRGGGTGEGVVFEGIAGVQAEDGGTKERELEAEMEGMIGDNRYFLKMKEISSKKFAQGF